MYNVFSAHHTQQNFRRLTQDEKKSEAWTKRYKTQIRPPLIAKHERRIQGFAKKMQCQPFILPQQQIIHTVNDQCLNQNENLNKSKYREHKLDLTNTVFKIKSFGKLKTQRMRKIQQNKIADQKYMSPIKTFRERRKSKQINPAMKYGNKNSHMILQAFQARRKKKKQKTIQNQQDHQSDQNLSQFDHLSLINSVVKSKQQDYKTQAQIKQEEQLKALSRGRLYFKSLVNFEQKVKDNNVKMYVRNILIRCKAIRPKFEKRKKQQTEIDYFAQMMRQDSVKSRQN